MTETISARPDLALYQAGRKSLPLAYFLWFFLGLFGAHRFYARAGRTGWWLLALHLAGWLIVGIGYWSGARTNTGVTETMLGTATFTWVDFDSRGGPLTYLGEALRGVAYLWWLVDIVLIPSLIRGWNNRLAAGLGMAVR